MTHFFPLIFATCLPITAAAAESVACHVTYGGETTVLRAAPVESAYTVGTTAIGSFFRMRLVFQPQPADQAAIRILVLADRDEGLTPIHQGTHPYPPAPGGRYGFTGLQFVYEPQRDGELQYWCALETQTPETAR